MGIILLFVSISELLLPSGIQILKDENCQIKEVSVGIELNPSAKINSVGKSFFEKTGYNYFYLKDMDSIATLSRFIKLLSQNKIFSQSNEDGPTNLLRLTLNDINGNSSPVISITLGITGKINEEKIIDIVNLIPDTLISNSSSYYNLKRVVGKHIYPGKENFIANISPAAYSEDFCVFLVFLKLMNNRNLKVRFSPETAPSPFLIYTSKDKIKSIFTKPQKNEIRRAVQEVANWIEILSLEKNKSRCLILTHSMGIEKTILEDWVKKIQELEDIVVQKAWEKYLTDGFVASLDSSLTERIKEIFPESAINLE